MELSQPRTRTGPWVNAPALSRGQNLLSKHRARRQTHLTTESLPCPQTPSFSRSRRIVLLDLLDGFE